MADEVMDLGAESLGEVEQPDEQIEAEEPNEPIEGEDLAEGEGEEGDEQPVEEEPEQPTEEKPAASQDGRTLPGPLKAAAAALKQSNPEGARMIRANWFENQQFKQQFATPAEAAAAKQQYEDLGGEEGIKAVQVEREEWAQVDRMIGEGKAAELLRDNPELLQKNAIGVINEFAKVAPEQYSYYADQVAINRVQSSGALGVMGELYKSLTEFSAQNPDLKPYLDPFVNKVVESHNRIVEIGERAQQFAQKQKDPREEEFARKQQEFETSRRADFEGRVEADVNQYRSTAVDKAIQGLLNGRKADADQMEIYRDKVVREVEKRLGQVPGFEQNLEAHYRTGDRGKSVEYVNRQIDKILTSGKAAEVIAPLLRSLNPVTTQKAATTQRPATASKSSEPGTVILREFPDHSQVDWNRTTAQDYAQGKAVLTNGKRATGWM